MIGITLTTDQIRSASKEVQQWIEHELVAFLGRRRNTHRARTNCSPRCLQLQEAAAVLSQIQGMRPAVNAFFKFSRPAISFGEPRLMQYRLIDILHHTKLGNIDQVMKGLEMINQALARVRGDASAKFCGFDSAGHCFISLAECNSGPSTRGAEPARLERGRTGWDRVFGLRTRQSATRRARALLTFG